MKMLQTLGIALVGLVLGAGAAQSQTWTPLTHQPTFQTDTALQLTDGTVIVHEYQKPNWWRLTPDSSGSYVNGTWSQIASMASNYLPLYFASAVLADGRVIVEGGEYDGNHSQTNDGAIYDPVLNTWTRIAPPAGWTEIGDSNGIVLANGTFMLGQNMSTRSALFNATNLTWTTTGAGKADPFEEEGWILLPDRTVLTTDAVNTPHAEKYVQSTGTWISAGSTIVRLEDPGSEEIGPMILRYDGTVFAMGGNGSGAGHTATYHPPANPMAPGTWTVGPDMPGRNDMADAPASILPNGDVLCDMSPGIFGPPVSFYEYDGTQFTQVPNPANPGSTSYQGRMLVLPTGQVLFLVSDGMTIDVEVFNASGNPDPSWAPTISSFPSSVTRGNSYMIRGTQFNGLSTGANYGDDAGMATNYPLVRITNDASGHVFYARTHDHSTMAVATRTKIVGTRFDVGSGIETGASHLEVVANGIASTPVAVTVH